MKKILLLCAAMIGVGFFISCEPEDNDEKPVTMVGNWKYEYNTTITIFHDGIHQDDTITDTDPGEIGYMYLRADGSGTIGLFGYDLPDYWPRDGVWDYSNDTLHFQWDFSDSGHPEEVYDIYKPILFLTADSFAYTKYQPADNREFYITYHYKRI